MGYSTKFKGELRFTSELTSSQLATLSAMLGEDCRDHPEWNAPSLYYIDLELTKDFGGLRWSGAEKTYELEKLVNVVTSEMRKLWPAFGLTGTFTAQGEEVGDAWSLCIDENGIASKQKLAVVGRIVRCPHCETRFALKDAGEA